VKREKEEVKPRRPVNDNPPRKDAPPESLYFNRRGGKRPTYEQGQEKDGRTNHSEVYSCWKRGGRKSACDLRQRAPNPIRKGREKRYTLITSFSIRFLRANCVNFFTRDIEGKRGMKEESGESMPSHRLTGSGRGIKHPVAHIAIIEEFATIEGGGEDLCGEEAAYLPVMQRGPDACRRFPPVTPKGEGILGGGRGKRKD